MTSSVGVSVRDRAVEVLCDASLEHIVDLVRHADADALVVANADGAVRLTANGAEVLHGRDRVADQARSRSRRSSSRSRTRPVQSDFGRCTRRVGNAFPCPVRG